jgi:cytochrome c553
MLKQIHLSLIVSLLLAGNSSAKDEAPHVVAKSPVEAGKYLVMVAGCNDCHTPGWLFMPGKIPESAWLTGWDMGWRGPWGTTYARNLRLSVAKYPVEDWIKLIESGTLLPPMPGENLKMAMSDEDYKSIYAYIKTLPLVDKPTPDDLPPGQEPKGPWINMMPNNFTPPPGIAPPGSHEGHGGH